MASSWAISTILMAIESSCMAASICRVHRERGKRRLAEADAAVVRWHRVVCPDLKLLARKQRLQVFQQQVVLEDSAGEHDGINSMLFAQHPYRREQSLRNSPLKCAGSLGYRASPNTIADDAVKQRLKVELMVGEWKRISIHI